MDSLRHKWLFAVLLVSSFHDISGGDVDLKISRPPLFSGLLTPFKTLATRVAATPQSRSQLMNQPEVTAYLTGTYTWELIMDIDNSNNSGSVQQYKKIITKIDWSYHELIRSIKKSSIKTSTSFNVDGIFEVLSIGAKFGVDTKLETIFDKMVDSKGKMSTETTKTETFTVGPHSKLTLYRLVFNGPGVNYQTDTISSTPRHMDVVKITANLRQVYVLSGISVFYTSDSASRPSNCIQEVDGKSPEINKGFHGKYVWLVPEWTSKPADAVSSINIAIQGDNNPRYRDLAKGSGGSYRYLVMIKDKNPNSIKGIGAIGLVRADRKDTPRRRHWADCTTDINEGRKGDYLYLCWNYVTGL